MFAAEEGAHVDTVAAHLLHAPPRGDRRAVEALRAAARHASAIGDPSAAVRVLRRALAEPPAADDVPWVSLELGRAAARAGLPEAVEALEACLDGDPPASVAAAATELLADIRMFSGRPDLALVALERGIALAGEGTAEAGRLESQLVVPAHISASVRARMLPRLRALTDPGGPARDAADLRALAVLSAYAIMDGNEGARAAELARRALAAPIAAPADTITRGLLTALSVTLMAAEDLPAAERLASRMMEEATRAGARAGVASMLSVRALIRYRAGRVTGAEADALASLELLPEAHGAEMLAHAGTGAAVLAGVELERPRAALEAILDTTPYVRDEDILPFSQILLARGHLLLAHGDPAGALRAFEACDRDLVGWGRDVPTLVPWRSGAAEALLALDRAGEARALADEELRLARASGLARATGMAQRVAALARDGEERAEGLEQAAASLAANPLELARTLADLAEARSALGRRPAAREAAEAAHAHAERAGATGLARRARRHLRALGTRPRTTAARGLSALTAAERRVADLAAAGRTNREIAEALFVSEKTVETHLARVFRKLDVRSRRQLPDLLG
jgi:DNA-binding CsgD family transcriptional regulator